MAAAKTAVLPAVTVSAAGWLLIDGGAGERVTVTVAGSLGTEPALLRATARYCVPLAATLNADVV